MKLSKLAHEFLALDKDRPEVCCLIGDSLAVIRVTLTLTQINTQEITIRNVLSMRRQ